MSRMQEIIEDARDLLLGGWSQGAVARNSAGEVVHMNDDSASSYCVGSALYLAANGNCEDLARIYKQIEHILSLSSHIDVVRWNDAPTTTKEMVADLFDQLSNVFS